jgi:cytochrome c oxidase subunit IV
MASEEGQQHPLKIYWIMWVSLFVLSGFSYTTDFMDDGIVRQFLILAFMFAKAGGIPPIFIGVLIWLMAIEGNYTELTRIEFFGESTMVPQEVHH